jgi:LysR family hca operon transcriptional activator
MELRHLRYFVAVAETGSLTKAAETRLHTAQPSLSRQLRELEDEVGAQLFTRGARGVELTAAGRAFLDHARLALSQAAEAVQAARRAVRPAKPTFSVGFLAGEEVGWLPHVTRILQADLPNIDLKVSSRHSTELADDIQRGEMDLGFLRVEPRPGITYQVIAQEPLVAVLPSDHRFAAQAAIHPQDLEGEAFIGFSDVPHVLQKVVNDYLFEQGVKLTPSHLIDNFGTGVSLVASMRGIALLPNYVEPLLPWSVISRPLQGVPPTIDLVIGYRENNASPMLRTFLVNIDQLREAGPAGSRNVRYGGPDEVRQVHVPQSRV